MPQQAQLLFSDDVRCFGEAESKSASDGGVPTRESDHEIGTVEHVHHRKKASNSKHYFTLDLVDLEGFLNVATCSE
jgi:hypothetical protein